MGEGSQPSRGPGGPKASTPTAVVLPLTDPNLHSPLRLFAFSLSAALLFLRISMLHQIQTRLMGANLRLLYLVGLPALLGLLLAGGIPRSFRGRPAYYYTGYAIWITIAVPFSSWRGGSAMLLWSFLRTDVVMLFMIAGIALTWKECKILMGAVAWGAVVNLLSARLFAADLGGYREGLQFGSISNPNDFAGHLLLALPFLLWVALKSEKVWVRAAALLGVCWGLKLILATASRGALVGLALDGIYFLWRGTMRQRVGFLLLVPVGIAAALAVLPQETLSRLMAFRQESGVETPEQQEALESSQAREYVLRQSLKYMFTHPLFGVGPGQFSSYEGEHNVVIGTHGYWHDTHNTFTQAGSECGIPALLLLVAGIVATFQLLHKTYVATAGRADCQDLRTAAFCMTLALVGFVTAITFLNFAYFFYLPAMGGFAILLYNSAQTEMRERSSPGMTIEPPYSHFRAPIYRAPTTNPSIPPTTGALRSL